MSDIPPFKDLVEIQNKGVYDPYKCIVALDPGETTGYALFVGTELISSAQIPSGSLVTTAGHRILKLLKQYKPSQVVMEDYRVYKWREKQHAWSALFTPRLIGAIEMLCSLEGIPVHKQMAQQPKQFCDDVKLKTWGLYVASSPHARDAIRHGSYYILFGEPKKKAKQSANRVG